MRKNRGTFARATRLLLLGIFAFPVLAQTYTLSGRVSDSSGHAVPSATVLAKNVMTGKTFTSSSNGDGEYTIADLAAGDYEVWAVAGELQRAPIKVTLSTAQTTDLIVVPAAREKSGADPPANQD